MTPLEIIKSEYTLPFKPFDHQVEALERALIFKKPVALARHKVGYGKSYIAMLIALYNTIKEGVEHIIIVCPPILIDQWAEFIRKFPELPEPLLYRGHYSVRLQHNLKNHGIIIMSNAVFVKDQDAKKVVKLANKKKIHFIFDEMSLVSFKTKTYQLVRWLLYKQKRVYKHTKLRHPATILNATPVSKVEQSYTWFTVLAPGIYRSYKHFERVHCAEVSKWGDVEEFSRLDLIAKVFEMRTLNCSEDALKLPPVNYTVIPYSLENKHRELYKNTQNMLLAGMPEKLTVLAVRSLFNALQGVVTSPFHFDLPIRPPVYDILEGYIRQLDPNEQVIVFTHRVPAIEALINFMKTEMPDITFAAIYGKVTGKAREEAFRRIKSGSAQILLASVDAVGRGLDLQFMHREFFVEVPFTSKMFRQAVGRISRSGQKHPCFVTVALAKGTIQRRIYSKMLRRDAQISEIMQDKNTLLDFLKGDNGEK